MAAPGSRVDRRPAFFARSIVSASELRNPFAPLDHALRLRTEHRRLLDLQQKDLMNAISSDCGATLEISVNRAKDTEQLINHGPFRRELQDRRIHDLVQVVVEHEKQQISFLRSVHEQGTDCDLGTGGDLAGCRPLITTFEKNLTRRFTHTAAPLAFSTRSQPMRHNCGVGLVSLQAIHRTKVITTCWQEELERAHTTCGISG